MEVKRQLDVLDKRLEENEFIVGGELTIADFAIYPWYGAMVRGLLYDAKDFLEVESYYTSDAVDKATLGKVSIQKRANCKSCVGSRKRYKGTT